MNGSSQVKFAVGKELESESHSEDDDDDSDEVLSIKS